jgi:phage replication-related protein YjqB (UPF0714/DUF867 family)
VPDKTLRETRLKQLNNELNLALEYKVLVSTILSKRLEILTKHDETIKELEVLIAKYGINSTSAFSVDLLKSNNTYKSNLKTKLKVLQEKREELFHDWNRAEERLKLVEEEIEAINLELTKERA